MIARVSLPAEKRLLLVGGGSALRCLIPAVAKVGLDIVGVLVDPLLESDDERHIGQSVASQCAALKIDILAHDDIAATAVATWILDRAPNIALVASWRRLIPDSFIEIFNGCALNIHNGPLPRHRGAGGLSWQVLTGERSATITVHQLATGIDTGAVVFERAAALDSGAIYPMTLINACHRLMVEEAFPYLADTLSNDGTLEVREQDVDAACYYPMLNTRRNGLLDFSWGVDDAERFVRAFSYPYPGATAHYRGRPYFIREASVRERNADVHPFMHGLVTNVSDHGVDVFVSGGILRLTRIADENGTDVPWRVFRCGNRFANSPTDLIEARLYRPRAAQ